MKIGDRIGNYQIEAPIAGGGMGMVYEGVNVGLGRKVAIKVLLPNFSHKAKVRHRFAQEAYVQAQLEHPNIVRVMDMVVEDEELALIMEFIEGPSLEPVLTETHPGPWSLAKTLAVFLPIVEAMAYAHERGIVHRDIKPGNVLLAPGPGLGVPKVTDFGLAKILADTSSMTKTGSKMGSIPYMSPEQFHGKKDISTQADVFALGVLLWRMLAGTLPVEPDNMAACFQFYAGIEPMRRLSSLCDELPPGIQHLLDRACALAPADRFKDAGELLNACAELRTDDEPEASLNPQEQTTTAAEARRVHVDPSAFTDQAPESVETQSEEISSDEAEPSLKSIPKEEPVESSRKRAWGFFWGTTAALGLVALCLLFLGVFSSPSALGIWHYAGGEIPTLQLVSADHWRVECHDQRCYLDENEIGADLRSKSRTNISAAIRSQDGPHFAFRLDANQFEWPQVREALKKLRGEAVVLDLDQLNEATADHLLKLTELSLYLVIRGDDAQHLHRLEDHANFLGLEWWGKALGDEALLGPIRKMTQLKLLGLSGPGITDEACRALNGLEELQVLFLNRTKITDEGVAGLSNLDQLQVLSLYGAPITDTALEEIVKFEDLQVLGLGGTKITDEGVAQIVELDNLQRLFIHDTLITDEGMQSIVELDNLDTLNIGGTKVTSKGLALLSEMTGLESFYAYGIDISDQDLAQIAKIDGLISLGLSGTQLNDAGMKHVSKLKKLRFLQLYESTLTNDGLLHLGTLSELRSLEVAGKRITDEGLKHLSDLKHLRHLSLRNTQVTAEGVKRLKKELPTVDVSL